MSFPGFFQKADLRFYSNTYRGVHCLEPFHDNQSLWADHCSSGQQENLHHPGCLHWDKLPASASCVAIAASTALPPCFNSISTPTLLASGWARNYCTITRNNFFITGILVRIDIYGDCRHLMNSVTNILFCRRIQHRKGKNDIYIRFTAGNQSLNRNDEFLYTLLVPDRARTVFPCFEQPNLKASFTLQLDIPSEWVAVSNTYINKGRKNVKEKSIYCSDRAIKALICSHFCCRKAGQTRI